jgi:hypothetical protein
MLANLFEAYSEKHLFMYLMDLVFSVVILFALYIVFSLFRNEKKAGISASPTMNGARMQIIELIQSHAPQENLRIAELGSGWGGLANQISKRLPGTHITGYEISPIPFIFSRISLMLNRKINILNNDFFAKDWGEYDVIVCYLSHPHMARIKERLLTMDKKILLVSCSFPLPDWEITEERSHQSLVKVPIYAYSIDNGYVPAALS